MEKNTMRQNAVYALFKSGIQTIFPIIVFAYVSRILNADGIGKINFANSFVSYFILIASLGINNYGTREGAKVRENKKEFSIFVKEIIIINLVMTILSLTAFYVIAIYQKTLQGYKSVLLIYSIAIPLSSMGMEWVYYAQEEYKYVTNRILLFRTMGLALTIFFVKDKDDFLLFAVIQVLTSYGNYALNWVHAKKYVNLNVKTKSVMRHLKPIFIFFASQVSYNLYSNVDITMLGILVSDSVVGVYSVAIKLVHVLLSAINITVAVFLPRVSFLREQHNQIKIREYFEYLLHYLYILIIPVIILMILEGQILIQIFAGEGYEGAYVILCVLIIDLLIYPQRAVIENVVLIPNNYENLIAKALAVGAVINIGLNYFMIQLFQGIGAAVSSVISELVIAMIYLIFLNGKNYKINLLGEIKSYLTIGILLLAGGEIIMMIIGNWLIIRLCIGVIIVGFYFAILIVKKEQYMLDILMKLKLILNRNRRI